MAYAAQELAQEKELDPRTRRKIEDTVKQELEEEITGDESERDVKALVDEILDEELAGTEGDDGFWSVLGTDSLAPTMAKVGSNPQRD